MVFKILGCIMVLFSSGFLGYVLSNDCKKRPQQLRELQSLMQLFENQISYLSDVLADAFVKVGRMSGCETGIFFTRTVEKLQSGMNLSASQAWEESVGENIRRTSLNREDGEILTAFGKILGSSDLEGQIKNIRLTMNQLKLQEEKAEASRRKNEGIYRSFGILGGLAIVIVLL